MSGLIFNGNGDVIKAVDGSLTIEGLDFGGGNVEAGIGTFTTLNVTGVLTYEDVKNVDSVGIVTARAGIKLTQTQSTINLDTSDGSDNKYLSIHGGGDASQSRGAGISLYGNEVTNHQGRLQLLAGNSGNANGVIQMHTGGAERLRITGDGPHLLLGGTTDVNEITETSGHAGMVIGGTGFGNAGLAIITSTTGAGRLYFGDNILSDAGRNRGAIIYYHSSDHMHFQTAGSERLRITSDGKMGIGVASPASESGWGNILHINSASAGAHIRFTDNTSGSGAGDGSYIGHYGNDTYLVNKESSGVIIFNTNSAERLRITSDGKMGIGVAAPTFSAINSISANAARGIEIFYDGTDTGTALKLAGDNGSGTKAWSQLGYSGANGTAHWANYNTGGTEVGKIIIGATGNIGIGDLSNVSNAPQVLFHIASTNPIFRIHDTTNDFYAHISADDGGNLTLDSDAGNGAGSSKIIFKTDGSEKLRITNDGTVGIGEDDPDGNSLLIRAASTVQTTKGHIMLTGDSATNGQGPQIVFSESGSGSSFAGAYIGHMREGSNSTGNLVFGTRASSGDANTVPTERIRITSSGDISIGSGGIVYGVSTLSIKPANRTTAFSASDGDTWHDVVLMQGGDAQTNAVGIAFEINESSSYHKNAGTGIAAVKNGTASDYGSDLVFITRGQSTAATEKFRITSGGLMGINTAVPTERLHVSGNAIVTGMILVGDGTTSNCAYANNGDNNTGFYFPAGDHLGLVTGGTERIRFSGGKTTITADGQVTAGHPNMILSVVNAGNASGGSYPGISLRSTHNGAGDGSYIWPTDDNWGLKTDANQAGLAFAPNGHSASSAHARLYIGTDGIITCGPETYNKIAYRKSSMTAFGVAGGAVSIGPAGNATACNEPGRYVLGWYMVNHTSSAYHHLKTDMWAGGSPHGNNEWIMGGFKIHGYRYNNAGVSEEIHYFHNWSGNYANYDIEHWGSWNANSLVYTSSDGYVTLRLAGGTYCGYVIDYIQHAWYTNRTTMVTSYTATNNSTI